MKTVRIATIFLMLFYSESMGFSAEGLQEILYKTAADGSDQPAMFFAPETDHQVPLLVVLHTWSGDYRQNLHAECIQRCMDQGWAVIHPNFRGPNRRPEATGSDWVIEDIASAVTHAKQATKIDPSRIYLLGTSGGGYTALLMAGRRPELWAGVSAWVPISDLEAWYRETKAAGEKYCQEIVDSCGGPPGTSDQIDRQYEKRSPLTYLANAKGLPLDINAGIRDGHEGSVPISHSLRAFNAVAAAADRISPGEIKHFVEQAQVPPSLKQPLSDPTYGEKQPLFRRTSGKARITIFNGKHELISQAALAWLQQQRKNASE